MELLYFSPEVKSFLSLDNPRNAADASDSDLSNESTESMVSLFHNMKHLKVVHAFTMTVCMYTCLLSLKVYFGMVDTYFKLNVFTE